MGILCFRRMGIKRDQWIVSLLFPEYFQISILFLSHISSSTPLDIEVPIEDLLHPPPQAAKNNCMRRVMWLVVCVFLICRMWTRGGLSRWLMLLVPIFETFFSLFIYMLLGALLLFCTGSCMSFFSCSSYMLLSPYILHCSCLFDHSSSALAVHPESCIHV